MAQYARGAREAAERVDADLRTALAYVNDGHEAVKRNPDYARHQLETAMKVIRDIRDMFDEEIRPRLLRAESRAAEKAVLEDILERLERLEERR